MKQPSTKTMILGHPGVAMPVMLAGAATLAAAFYGSNLLVGILGVAVVGTAQKAHEQARAYKAWQREWNGMAPGGHTVRKRGWCGVVVAGLALGWFGLACAGGADPYTAAIGTLGLVGLGVAAVMAVRRLSGSCSVGAVVRPDRRW